MRADDAGAREVERWVVALLLDEYSGTAGLVTLEELVEALVGQIEQESTLDGERGKEVAAGGTKDRGQRTSEIVRGSREKSITQSDRLLVGPPPRPRGARPPRCDGPRADERTAR
jgi:hypothetical protein